MEYALTGENTDGFVIKPKAKVGDTVYFVAGSKSYEEEVCNIHIRCDSSGVHIKYKVPNRIRWIKESDLFLNKADAAMVLFDRTKK